jgi:hypothetical protein
MTHYVRTTAGHEVAGVEHAQGRPPHGLMTEDQASADAADRNKRAAEMGIKTRYEAAAYTS